VLHVGDSFEADYLGIRRFGGHGALLHRGCDKVHTHILCTHAALMSNGYACSFTSSSHSVASICSFLRFCFCLFFPRSSTQTKAKWQRLGAPPEDIYADFDALKTEFTEFAEIH
jgi:hypothetical protein